MIGLILAGGNSNRLYPLNQACSKQLLPIYDKPLIYYPLSNLLLLGIKKYIIIIKPNDKKNVTKLLGNGKKFGINIKYIEQAKPNGIPEALTLAEKYIKNEKIFMILGDNIFYANTLSNVIFSSINKNKNKCNIFLYEVDDPKDYGVASINKKNGLLKKIIEKPKTFISNYVVTGLYVFNKHSINLAKKLKKSKRGEFEISDLLNLHIKENLVDYTIFERGVLWIDAGTPKNIFKSTQIIELIENRNKNKIACIEEICLEKKFISKSSYKKLISDMPECEYKRYLEKKLNNE